MKHKPYSIFAVERPQQNIRKFNVSSSSRHQYSPFPMDVADYIVSFYLRDAKTIFDPFAGWGERGLACKSHDKAYIGFDTSKTAINHALETFGVCNIFNNSLKSYIPSHDGLITCPPYWNVEKEYDGDGLDKIETWEEFLKQYKKVLKRSVKKGRSGATYCVVVGDFRRQGVYYDLTFQTEKIFNELGLDPFDKVVLDQSRQYGLNKVMTLPRAKRLGYSIKIHQTLLVYKKNFTDI